ncbi:MAG TPA: hypothetical protein VFP80_03075 [Thermoanaerobaculia bacterium]|nr:hypothetical protein [Thermoanaerobaculia bacterium]
MTLFLAAVAWADPVPSLSERLLGERRLDVPASGPEGWRVAPPEAAGGAASGLAFDLPAEAVTPFSMVTVAVSNGTRVNLEETIVLPSELAAAPTISFLANHPRLLARIRSAAASRPDAIRFQVSVDGNPIVDVPFVDADRGSDRLANGGSIAGSSESVLLNMRERRKLPMMGPCEDACDQAFFECYLNCDERGPGCPWCQTQYSDCLWYCSH